jgi:hypothetical protein
MSWEVPETWVEKEMHIREKVEQNATDMDDFLR